MLFFIIGSSSHRFDNGGATTSFYYPIYILYIMQFLFLIIIMYMHSCYIPCVRCTVGSHLSLLLYNTPVYVYIHTIATSSNSSSGSNVRVSANIFRQTLYRELKKRKRHTFAADDLVLRYSIIRLLFSYKSCITLNTIYTHIIRETSSLCYLYTFL